VEVPPALRLYLTARDCGPPHWDAGRAYWAHEGGGGGVRYPPPESAGGSPDHPHPLPTGEIDSKLYGDKLTIAPPMVH